MVNIGTEEKSIQLRDLIVLIHFRKLQQKISHWLRPNSVVRGRTIPSVQQKTKNLFFDKIFSKKLQYQND